MRKLILVSAVLPLLFSSCGSHKVNYTVTLTVTSEHGNPVPTVGTHTYRFDSNHPPQIDATVEQEIDAGTTIYTCSGWKGTGDVPSSGSSNQVSFTLKNDSTLTWSWQAWHQVAVNTMGSGEVDIRTVSGQENPAHTGFYAEGSVLQLTPIPDTGYVFSHWQDSDGNVVGNDSPLEITVNAPVLLTAVFVEQLTVATTQADIDAGGYGMVGANYSFSLQATGGWGTYHWQVKNGAFPPGLALADDGTISGTPTVAGNYTFTVSVTDDSPYPFTAYATFTITIYETLTITTESIPGAVNGQNYSAQIEVTGGSGSYTFSMTDAPAGLSIDSSTGEISGTPADTPGIYDIKVNVTDNYNDAWGANRTLKVVLVDELTVTTTQADIDAGGYGMVGANYSFSLQATGGWGTYHWQVKNGAFPPGLALADDGTISGTPTVAGNYTFTVSVTDDSPYPFTAYATFTITIYETLTITTESIPGAVNGQNYSAQIEVTGGSGSYTFAISGEPTGVSIDASNGVISGAPNDAAGTYTVTVTVTDNYNAAWTASRNLTLNLADMLTLTAQTYSWTEGTAVSGSVPCSGGWSPVEFRIVSGGLPPGTYLNPDGTYGGSPTTAGQYTAVIEARDALNPQQFAYQTYTYDVKPVAPSGLTVDVRAGSGVILRWTDNSCSEANYVVQRSDDNGATWSEIAVLPADTTEFTDQHAPFGNTTVRYRVVARALGNIDSDYAENGPFTIPESIVAGFLGNDRAYKIACDGNMVYVAWYSDLLDDTVIAAYDVSAQKWVWAYCWRSTWGCDDLCAATVGGSKYVVAREGNYICCIKDGEPAWTKYVKPSSGSFYSITIFSDALYALGYTWNGGNNDIFLAKLNLSDGALVNSWGIELDDDGAWNEDEWGTALAFADADTAYIAGMIRIDRVGTRHLIFIRLTDMSTDPPSPTFSSACYVTQNIAGSSVQVDSVDSVRADGSGNCCAIVDEWVGGGIGSFVGGVSVTYNSALGTWSIGWRKLWGDGTLSRLLGSDECGWLATFNSIPNKCVFAQFDPTNGDLERKQSIGEKAPAYYGSLCYDASNNRYYKLISTSYFLDDNIAARDITVQTPGANIFSLRGNIYGAGVTVNTAPPLVAIDLSQINPAGSPYGDDDAAVFWHNP